MPAKIYSCAVTGLDCHLIEIEVDILNGLPRFIVVGLGDTAVQEAKERVCSAIKNSGAKFPRRRKIVNLAPADFKKHGPAFDLPIAVGLLFASNQLENSEEGASENGGRVLHKLKDSILVGELSLEGDLRSVSGILPMVEFAQEKKFKRIFLPASNFYEASLIPGVEIMPVRSLKELIEHFQGKKEIVPGGMGAGGLECLDLGVSGTLGSPAGFPGSLRTLGPMGTLGPPPKFPGPLGTLGPPPPQEEGFFDMSEIKGQENVKRALEIAAAGAHNILLVGPPGSGKTLLARTLRTILPELTLQESLEVTKIYSVAGLLPKDQPLIRNRPVRAVHHTASSISLVGGGPQPKPGEISLAHKGVLFLDELAEFPRSVLELLRQPLEDRVITVSRVKSTLTFPADFTLVAAMNPCPCGFLGDPKKDCVCNAAQLNQYQRKLSGPFLDRIDLHIEVPRVKLEKLTTLQETETSAQIRARVQKARDIQTNRFKNTFLTTNAEMGLKQIKKYCELDPESLSFLKTAASYYHLSARAYFRVLKVARTIADLEGSEKIKLPHLQESLSLRPKLKKE